MKKVLFALLTALLLCSCSNEELHPYTIIGKGYSQCGSQYTYNLKITEGIITICEYGNRNNTGNYEIISVSEDTYNKKKIGDIYYK